MPLDPAGPNAEQAQFWNETAAARWIASADTIDDQIRPLGEVAMERGRVARGERVLDVGCGTGHTTRALAGRVGAGGHVLGVDLSEPLLAVARDAARRAGLANVHFEHADAQTHAFPEGAFDVLYSRFGVMFFAHPEDAFANLRRALAPDGRVAFVCWQALSENPWMLVPLLAGAQHLTLPAAPPPAAPGPFAFADADRVRALLEQAGYADVATEALHHEMVLGGRGGGLDSVVQFMLELGPLGAAMREAGPEVRPAVAAAVHEAITPYFRDGAVRMPGAAWVVTARRGL